MAKINFHLYANFGTISSLLTYVYRKGFGSTVVNLSNLKILLSFSSKYSFPRKVRWGNSHVSLLQNGTVLTATTTSSHHPFKPGYVHYWSSPKGKRSSEWLQGLHALLYLRWRTTCAFHRTQAFRTWFWPLPPSSLALLGSLLSSSLKQLAASVNLILSWEPNCKGTAYTESHF